MREAVLPVAATMFGPILTIPYVRPNGDELGYLLIRISNIRTRLS